MKNLQLVLTIEENRGEKIRLVGVVQQVGEKVRKLFVYLFLYVSIQIALTGTHTYTQTFWVGFVGMINRHSLVA